MFRRFWWIPRAEKYSGHGANAILLGSPNRVAVPGNLFPANRPEVPISSYKNRKSVPGEKGPERGGEQVFAAGHAERRRIS
jgi:hypothetical protein